MDTEERGAGGAGGGSGGDRRRSTRVAVGLAATAAVGVMSNIATTAAGSFWAAHALLAWVLLGVMVAVLTVNECWDPRRDAVDGRPSRRRRSRGLLDRRDAWLAGMIVLGTALSLLLWFSSRVAVIPDGAEPEAYGCGGPQDPTAVREATGAMILYGREVGIAAVFYSPKCGVVWGQYSTEAHIGLEDPGVTVVIVRSTDGARESANDLALTDDQNAPGHADWTPVLRYVSSACYSTQVTLTSADEPVDSASTGCETF